MNRSIAAIPRTQSRAAHLLLPAPPPLNWHIVGAAVQGVSHARLNLPCQDAQAYRLLPDGTLLVALSDGAGSARFSEQGADYAVMAALQSLSAAFEGSTGGTGEEWERRIRTVFLDAHDAIVNLAEMSEDQGITPRDYAATLTCVVASADRLAVGQVGDGAVVAVDGDGNLFAVTRLQRGEYANETHFISEEDAQHQAVIDVIEISATALAVMSDGLIRLALKMPAQEPHVPFFQPLLRFAGAVKDDSQSAQQAIEQLSAFLASERVNARTDDDKSLVLAVRDGAAFQTMVSQAPAGLADRRYTRDSLVSSLPDLDTIGAVAPFEVSSPDDEQTSSGVEPNFDRDGE